MWQVLDVLCGCELDVMLVVWKVMVYLLVLLVIDGFDVRGIVVIECVLYLCYIIQVEQVIYCCYLLCNFFIGCGELWVIVVEFKCWVCSGCLVLDYVQLLLSL